MKRYLLLIPLAFALATTPVVLTGCSTTKPAAYKTLVQVRDITDAAFKSYLSLVVEGKISSAGIERVSASYAIFQVALNAALVAAQTNEQATAPPQLVVQSDTVLKAVREAKGEK